MPRVERTGIYRNQDNGSALFLRKDRIVGADVLEDYELDESPGILDERRQALVDAENASEPRAFVGAPLHEYGTVGTVNGETVPASADVVSKESDNASYPRSSDAPDAPTPVKPPKSRRQSKKDAAAVEAPEDALTALETPEDRATAFESPEAPRANVINADAHDSDGDGKSDEDEAEESAV